MKIEPLTKQAFSPFGEVVEMEGAEHFFINQHFAERFNNLAHVDVNDEGGSVNVSIAAATPRPKPIAIKLMERHPLGSQIFYPLQNEDWLVLVCTNPKVEASYRLFQATGQQGINYGKNVWHHPLLVLNIGKFLVIDRKGPGINLEETELDRSFTV